MSRTRRRHTPAWVTTLLLMGILTATFASLYVSDRGERATAVHLQAHGTVVVADQVRMTETGWTRAGTFRVEVTVDGRAVMLRGVTAIDSVEPPPRTWVTPPPGDRYASPLHVLVDPDDPDVAMAAFDAQDLADPELLPGDLALLAAAAALTAVVTLAVWTFERRRTQPRTPRHTSPAG